MKKIYKNKLVIIIVLMLLAVVFLSWFFVFKNKPAAEPLVIINEEIDFQKEIHLFNKVIKYAWYNTEINDLEGSVHRTQEAYTLWEKIDKSYKINPPAEYNKTKDWQSFSFKMDKSLKKSNELAQEKNLNEAQQEIRKAMKLIDDARAENDIEYYSDELLSFYELVKRSSEAKNKETLQPYLAELKIAYTFLKELHFEDSLLNIVFAMEDEIGHLDKFLDGPDFKKSQTKLKELFFDLYLKY